MNKVTRTFLGATCLCVFPAVSQAAEVGFALGTGYPFFAIPEVSVANDAGDQRWFANYKAGLDDGFSLGFEKGLGQGNFHSVGIVAGAIGVSDDERACNSDDPDNIGEALGSAIGCALAEAFDDEVTNGVGLSYTYNFNGLNQSGMRLRFELGYGEGADSDESRADGAVILSYQF